MGATQDFSESVLPKLLRSFARTHPRGRLELRVGRSHEPAMALDEGAAYTQPNEVGILREPMLWLCAADGLVAAPPELPLALLDTPCGFRTAAITALDVAQRPYKLVTTSALLSGLVAAVSVGVAVTLRTAGWGERGGVDVSSELDLPTVPDAVFSIRLRHDADIATDLADLLGAARSSASAGTIR